VRRHDLDLVSLITGALFLLVATTHLLAAGTEDHPGLGWLVPVVLVGLGVAGLAGALRSSWPPGRESATPATSEAPVDEA
jgi:hypothetical protein